MLVDTLGFLLEVKVTPADLQDRDGARLLLPTLTKRYGWLKRIWADGGYAGQLEKEVANLPRHRQIDLEIIKRSDDVKGFKILPKRWVVERTFGWLVQSRRLIRDHEVKIDHSEALIYLSMPAPDQRPQGILAQPAARQRVPGHGRRHRAPRPPETCHH